MKNLVYKYINLLFRITIGIIALGYIYLKIEKQGFDQFYKSNPDSFLFFAAFLLLFVNWGMEAYKWKFAIRSIEKINLFKSIKYTFTGITVGILTPNRIGEIPIRALFLKKASFQDLVFKTAVSSFSQLMATILTGGVAFLLIQGYSEFTIDQVWFNAMLALILFFVIVFYFNINKLIPVINKIKFLKHHQLLIALTQKEFAELLVLLVLSALRYMIFALQYWLILMSFGIELITFNELLLIPICFLIGSVIPTILISEIGVRGSVALFVFGVASDMDTQLILASISLWLINVGIPAIIGLFGLKEFKLLRKQ